MWIIEVSIATDYTGEIHSFSEIGPGGPGGVTPRPWVCDIDGDGSSAQWQTPDGSTVPPAPSDPITNQLTGSELYTTFEDGGPLDRLHLFRGPDYNSPDGEYCCVLTAVANQRRCVTLSECGGVEKKKSFPSHNTMPLDSFRETFSEFCILYIYLLIESL